MLTNAQCLRAIVNDRFFEPRVLESLLGSDAVLRIVHEYPLEEVEELSVKRRIRWNEFLGGVSNWSMRRGTPGTYRKLFHSLDIFP